MEVHHVEADLLLHSLSTERHARNDAVLERNFERAQMFHPVEIGRIVHNA
jgi:hypothetical protein